MMLVEQDKDARHCRIARDEMSRKPAKTAKIEKLAPPAAEEEILRQLQQALSAQSLANPDEVKNLLQSLMGQALKQSPADLQAEALKDEAQDLAFAAMEAKTKAQARKLARQALGKDPDCVDALVVLASIESDSPQQMIQSLQKAAEAGSAPWGRSSFRKTRATFGA